MALESTKENHTPLVTPAVVSRRRSAEKGPEAVYEGSGSQRRRESRFRGTNQLLVPEGANADADPYRFLPKPAPRTEKVAVDAPRVDDDDAADEPRGRLSFGEARISTLSSLSVTVSDDTVEAPAVRATRNAATDIVEDTLRRSSMGFSDDGRRSVGSSHLPSPPASAPADALAPPADAEAFGCLGLSFPGAAEDTTSPRHVSKVGYLRKRGRVNTAWRTRWCEAWPDKGRLYYFRDYDEKKCRGYIDCARATAIEPLDDGSFSDLDDHASRSTAPYAFRVLTPGAQHGEEWMLQAASAAEREAWVQCLRGMMGGAPAPRRASKGDGAPREECTLM
jgi:hypothetical protein